jgi:pyridoxamine 5'-phosphate oxidase family protein
MSPQVSEAKSRIKFTENESKFLKENRLGRVATAAPNLQPHVVPVGYEFDDHYIYFSGYNLSTSLKFRNLKQNRKIAFVVDDLVSLKPWNVRGIEVRGVAEILTTKQDPHLGRIANVAGSQPYIKIIPHVKRSWGF